jgi:Gpi18-like mannosyltransferase
VTVERSATTVGAGPVRRGWSRVRVGARFLAQPAVVAVLGFVAVRALVLLTLLVAARREGRDAHRLLVAWDGQWYAAIAEHGYAATTAQADGRSLAGYAFFPLLPALERAIGGVTGIAAADAGLLVSAVTSVFAAWGIFAVAAGVHGDRVGVAAVLLWGLLPIGVVESMAYSESLFTALAAWTLASVRADRWVTAGVLACLAGLARPAGAALAGTVVVAAAVRLGTRPRAARPLVAAVLAPLGWLAYVAWVGVRRHSPFG